MTWEYLRQQQLEIIKCIDRIIFQQQQFYTN